MNYQEINAAIEDGLYRNKSAEKIFDQLASEVEDHEYLKTRIKQKTFEKTKSQNKVYHITLIILLASSLIIKALALTEAATSGFSLQPQSLISLIITGVVIWGIIKYQEWGFQLIFWFGLISLIFQLYRGAAYGSFDILSFILTLLSVIISRILLNAYFPKKKSKA